MTADYRALFMPCNQIYLLNHSVGRPPLSTERAWKAAFIEPWQNHGDAVWPRWLEAIADFKAALAALLNDSADNFSPQTNLSSALTKIIQSLPLLSPRDTIVYSEEDFPSIAFVLQQTQRLGYKLHAISASADTTELTTWDAAITSRTAFVLVTHVQSNSGCQVPVAGITALVRERGAVSIVDVAQSVGVIPINLNHWSADFVIGSCVKWLCGGPGAGFLWVRPELLPRCRPLDVGWFSHRNPFEFEIHNFEYSETADRFWGGTPSVQPFVVATNSLNTMRDVGIEKIRHHNLTLTEQLITAIPETWLRSPRQPDKRGATVVVNAGENNAAIESALKDAGVLFDTRPSGFRLSPHIYNDSDDIAAAATAFAQN